MEAALARRGRAGRLYQQRRHPARRDDGDAVATRPRRSAEAKPSAPTSAARSLAERVVERMVAERGLPAVIVNPSTPDRPARHQADAHRPDHRRGGARAHAGLRRHRPQPGPCRRCRAQGHLLALDKGRIGERYILGGQDVTPARDAGRHRRPDRPQARRPSACRARRSIPWPAPPRRWPSSPARSRSLTRDALKMSRHHMFFSSAKAERELGYRARPYARGAGRRARLVPRRGLSADDACDRADRLPAAGDLALSAARPRRVLAGARARRRGPSRRAAGAGPRWSPSSRRATRPMSSRARSAACWRRTIPATSGSSWSTTTAATAPAASRAALRCRRSGSTVIAGAPRPPAGPASCGR